MEHILEKFPERLFNMKKKTETKTEINLEIPNQSSEKEIKTNLDIQTEYQLNLNSNKYSWNEAFVQKIADKIFNWFNSDKTLWFYSDFPRQDLHMTFNQFIRKMSEFPLIWDDIHNELKLMTTTRLAEAMLKNKISVPGAIQALKNMGDKWNDKSEVNLNVKSIGELIADAWSNTESVMEDDKIMKLIKINKPINMTDDERKSLFNQIDNPEE